MGWRKAVPPRRGGGCSAWNPWLMPSAETVGSKARVSRPSLRRCWSACRDRERARKEGRRSSADVRASPRVRGRRCVKEVRSAESRVGRDGGLKDWTVRARERAVEKIMMMERKEVSSRIVRVGVAIRSQ